jgi:hypothetical protein
MGGFLLKLHRSAKSLDPNRVCEQTLTGRFIRRPASPESSVGNHGIRPKRDPHPIGGGRDRWRNGVAAAPKIRRREGGTSNLGPGVAAHLGSML